MKIFDEIQEGKWQEFCQDWIERRDNIQRNKRKVMKALLFSCVCLLLCSCIDNAVKLKGHNGESYWIDTLTIHGNPHEVIIKNHDKEFNGFMHSPECWCLNKEVNENN